MKTASVTELNLHFNDFLAASKDGPIVVTRNGRPVAVLVGEEDGEEVERLVMAYSPRLNAKLDASLAKIKAGKGIRHEELWTRINAKTKRISTRGRESQP